MILAGDIGGTNSRLALFSPQLEMLYERASKNAGRPNLAGIVAEFLDSTALDDHAIDRACFGVAGPVENGRVTLTNLNWQIDASELGREFKLDKFAVVNDLVAHAEGIEVLKPEHFVTLAAGDPDPRGNRAVIAPGTGLGEAGLIHYPDISGYRAFPSEGGHCDFSPRTEQDFALARYIQEHEGIATWERVLSGPGLRRIYDFLANGNEVPDLSPEQITHAALASANPTAVAALDLFCRYYAAEAGNLALKLLATAGVYLAGGIAMSLIDRLKSDSFLENFRDKGPAKLRALINRIPLHVVMLDTCALYGAANYARRL